MGNRAGIICHANFPTYIWLFQIFEFHMVCKADFEIQINNVTLAKSSILVCGTQLVLKLVEKHPCLLTKGKKKSVGKLGSNFRHKFNLGWS